MTGEDRTSGRARIVVAAVLLSLASLAPAAEPMSERLTTLTSFNIPAQPLGAALKQLADQAGIQILFEEQVVRGLEAPAVQTHETALQALAALLEGTGLEFAAKDQTVAVRRKSTAHAQPTPGGRMTGDEGPRSGEAGRSVAVDRIRLAQGESSSSSQSREESSEGTPPRSATQNAAQGDPIEQIVVTGSRITRAAYAVPAPVTTVSAETIASSGFSNLNDVLLRTPAVSVGLGSANANFNNDAGASFLNLRGLGTERTLVLVNGKRRVSGTATSSAVDISAIPANMVERVEVITGGAAAVYGADAVTGVVNLILKDHVKGLQFDTRGGAGVAGGPHNYSTNLLFGSDFDDARGSFTFGASYNVEGLLLANQRDFGRSQIDLFSNPANTGPNDGIFDQIAVSNYRYPNTSYGGAFIIGGTRYTIDPTLRPTQNDSLPYGPTGYLGVGGDGFNAADFAPLRDEIKVFSSLGHLTYELADNLSFFTDLQFAHTRTRDPRQPTFNVFDITIARSNPFVPADVGTLMDANGMTTLSVGRTNWDQGIRVAEIERDTFTVVGGLNGRLNERFDWLAFGQYGRYQSTLHLTNEPILSRFDLALDAQAGADGQPQCADAAARAAGCQPLNIFGPHAASAGALDYILHTRIDDATNTQTVAGAQLTGGLFDLPAGEVQLATGVEYRKETLATALDGLAATGDLFDSSGSKPVDADFNVKEAFVESLVPVLKDARFAKSFELEAAARYSDYSTIDNTTAWKVGAQWAPLSDIRFRVTRSTSVRAPNLTELFNPGTDAASFVTDPCTAALRTSTPTRSGNCSALGIPLGYVDPIAGSTKIVRSGGNPDLSEETSRSWTAGVVLTPGLMEHLSASVDYWKVDLDDAVGTLGFQTIVDRCVDSASTSNPFCPLVSRRTDHAISVVDTTPINIGGLIARGIDVQTGYALDLGASVLRFDLAGTYLLELERLVDAGDPSTLVISDGTVDDPRVRANLATTYGLRAWSLAWNLRYISSSKIDRQISDEARSDNHVAARFYNDLFARYGLTEKYEVYAGLNNVFDVEPPRTAVTFQGTGTSSHPGGALYDNVGRYLFVGVNARF